MGCSSKARARRYRVWIVRYSDWQPDSPHDRPPGAVAVEPAEEGSMTQAQARAYTEAFNRAALAAGRKLWTIALPVTLRYDGEPQPGEVVC